MSSAERFREIYEEKAMGAGLRIGGEGGCSECGGGGMRIGGAPKGYKACKKSKAISEKSGQKYYKHYAPKGKEHKADCEEKAKRGPSQWNMFVKKIYKSEKWEELPGGYKTLLQHIGAKLDKDGKTHRDFKTEYEAYKAKKESKKKTRI